MRDEELQQLLLEHWELLFDTASSSSSIMKYRSKGFCTFSELAVMLITTHGDLLADTFVVLIFDKHCININKVLKVNDFAENSLKKLENFAQKYATKKN